MKKQTSTPVKQQALVTHNWSGPLPPPDALARFDQIIPHGAERILKMTEQEQAHRIATEQAAQQASIQNSRDALQANIQNAKDTLQQSKQGLDRGTVVSVLSILAATITALLGANPVVSVALVSVPIVGMVKALIGDRSKQDK